LLLPLAALPQIGHGPRSRHGPLTTAPLTRRLSTVMAGGLRSGNCSPDEAQGSTVAGAGLSFLLLGTKRGTGMLTEAAVVGALVGAVVGALVAAGGFAVQARLETRQRFGSLVILSFEHLTGGSQKRSVGIAGLRALQGDEKLWRQYREAAMGLFVAQLRYVLIHGRNRWEWHEVRNIEDMMGFLLSEYAKDSAINLGGAELAVALDHYRSDWEREGSPNSVAVSRLLMLSEKWREELHNGDGGSDPSSPNRRRLISGRGRDGGRSRSC
jgi:hypothetical protein